MVNILPTVSRIQGLLFEPAQSPKDAKIQLQYTDDVGGWHQTTMTFLDAMYLFSLLKAIQTESGFRVPDDPFVPPDLHNKPTPTGTITQENLTLLDLEQPVTVTWVPADKITTSAVADQQSRSFTSTWDAVRFVIESLRPEDRQLVLAMTNRGLLRKEQFEQLYKGFSRDRNKS